MYTCTHVHLCSHISCRQTILIYFNYFHYLSLIGHCKLQFISSTEPIFKLLEQAWYSTHTDFLRQTRTVNQMNQLLLCIYSIVFSRVESGVCILNIDGALQYPPILADLVNIMDINISKMTPII